MLNNAQELLNNIQPPSFLSQNSSQKFTQSKDLHRVQSLLQETSTALSDPDQKCQIDMRNSPFVQQNEKNDIPEHQEEDESNVQSVKSITEHFQHDQMLKAEKCASTLNSNQDFGSERHLIRNTTGLVSPSPSDKNWYVL